MRRRRGQISDLYNGRTLPARSSRIRSISTDGFPPGRVRAFAADGGGEGIIFLSTPFDEASADLLEAVGIPAFKVGSGEVTHLTFLNYLAEKGKPMILSTGMSTWNELDAAVQTIRDAGNESFCLLHCVSAYPCPPEEANRPHVITALRERYNIPIGFSDHTVKQTLPRWPLSRWGLV